MGNDFIQETFQALQQKGKNLFVPYIMAGDGGLDRFEEQILFLEKCGVAAIEVGIPFSDPIADGPIIQAAGERSLAKGTTLSKVLSLLKDFKEKRNIPIIIMSYMNPIYTYGIEAFAKACQRANVQGVIIPDLPLEEEGIVTEIFQKYSLALIRLVALTSSFKRIRKICKNSEGFIYAVSVMGTTGVREHDQHVNQYLERIKGISPIPVLAGFGISTPEQAKNLGSACDGVIVGSRMVEWFHENKWERIEQFIQQCIEP